MLFKSLIKIKIQFESRFHYIDIMAYHCSIQVTVYYFYSYREWNRKCSDLQGFGLEPLTKKRKLQGMKLS